MLTARFRFYFILMLMGICLWSCSSSKYAKSWQDNYSKGLDYIKNNTTQHAIPYLNKAYTIAKDSIKSKKKFRDALVAYYDANISLKKFSVIDSLKLTDMLLKSSKGLNKKKLLNYTITLERFADSLSKYRQYDNAIKLYEKRKSILNKNSLTNASSYAETLYKLVETNYKSTGKYTTESKLHLEKILDIIASLGSIENVSEDEVLMYLLSLYISIEDHGKSEYTLNNILHNNEENYGILSKEYSNALASIARIYWGQGILYDAFQHQNKSIAILDSLKISKDFDYASAKYILALIQKDSDNYLESIDLMNESYHVLLGLNKEVYNEYIAIILGNISLNYDRIGDYEKAIYYCDKALETPGIPDQTKSIRLMDKAYFYQNMGRYSMSHKVYNLAKESMQNSHRIDHEKYAKLLNNIGKLYFEEQKFKEAETYFKQALDINEKPKGEKWHKDYSYMLNDYAKTLLELGDNQQAIHLMEKNLRHFEEDSLPKDKAYYNRKYSLAKAYNFNGDFKKALPLIKEATDNLKLILGEEHIDYGDFLKTLSNTYFGLGMKADGISSLLESNTVFVNQINKIFQFSSEHEKASFLKMITNNFNQMQSLSQGDRLKDASLDIVNLNNQLMLKGLLLNNSKDILSKLSKIGNDSLNQKISDYKNDKNKLSKLLTQYDITKEKEIDSLKGVVNEREAELVKYYSTNFEGGISLNRNWEDVRTQLKEDEVAIEFAHFNEYKNNKPTDQISYIAYIITKDQHKPTVISLFKEKDLLTLLDKRSPNSLYAVRGSKSKSMKSSKGLYNLVWLPIENYLKNHSPKKKVYFALSGLLNQIPMSALGTKEKPILSHQYDLYQVGSTYNLTKEVHRDNDNSVLLIGGVDYYTTDDSFIDDSKWKALPGTIEEVKAIEKIISKKVNEVSLWESNNATEKRFKALSGQSPNIIHIATHGFFYENPEASKSNVDDNVSNIYRSSKDPLLRSGLILAGANEAWENNSYYGEDEDGILTAMEIANLDLSNTRVVVLSACETGLGDINGSEGVYGLQRAFKMAGVDTLIMSLWQVPDKETAIFMEAFYKNWSDDNTIRTAFIETQRSLSKKYKDDPFKWAAFVLFE